MLSTITVSENYTDNYNIGNYKISNAFMTFRWFRQTYRGRLWDIWLHQEVVRVYERTINVQNVYVSGNCVLPCYEEIYWVGEVDV